MTHHYIWIILNYYFFWKFMKSKSFFHRKAVGQIQIVISKKKKKVIIPILQTMSLRLIVLINERQNWQTRRCRLFQNDRFLPESGLLINQRSVKVNAKGWSRSDFNERKYTRGYDAQTSVYYRCPTTVTSKYKVKRMCLKQTGLG